jgi:hypothetical protein
VRKRRRIPRYLADDTFVLIRCAFCGDDIDATDLVLADDAQAA